MRVLAIDQGTTNTKALLIDDQGAILARATAPLHTSYPRPGWAEQSAADIWASVQRVIAHIAAENDPPDAIAIANQRETLVLWDSATGLAICPAPLWQCRRTADDCARLITQGHDDAVIAATGLGINPLFPASKLGWVMRNVPAAADLHAKGRLRAGTVDAWLLWNLTGGATFATDHSNASRTQLFDTRSLTFSPQLATIFGAFVDCLPSPRPSDSLFGTTATGATVLPAGIPIHAMMGDSHAALFGHGIRTAGVVKATYGTGSSLMALTPARRTSCHGLSGTVAWTDKSGTAYALEGNITVSAQAAAFMAGLLGLPDAAALSALAQTVPDAGGVTFVPALAGLGAPHWQDTARGTIAGMTHATTPAHLARATYEAIAHQIADVLAAMEADIGTPLASLLADGGASGNAFLMQLQADVTNRPVHAAFVEETGALGVAGMAMAAMGGLAPPKPGSRAYAPAWPDDARQAARTLWTSAIAQSVRPA